MHPSQDIQQHKMNSKKIKARFGPILRPPTWKWNGPIQKEADK